MAAPSEEQVLYGCPMCAYTSLIEEEVIYHFDFEHNNAASCAEPGSELGLGLEESLTSPCQSETIPDRTASLPRYWSKAETMMLINLVKEFDGLFQTQVRKHVWAKIATQMNQVVETPLTGVQCDSKWKGLKSTFKTNKDHNGRSGFSKKHWEFYELMDDVIGKKPEVSPVATISSSRGLLCSLGSSASQQPEGSSSSSLSLPGKSTDDENGGEPATYTSSFTRKRKKAATNSTAVASRHEERMEKQQRFLDIFEKMVDKM